MSYKPIIYQNLSKKSSFSKFSKFFSLCNEKIMIKKILNIEKPKSGDIIEFENSIKAFVKY